ncbi:Cupredoxin [Zychaea mexicana]|uniref:Cupredoxin n=1 Tax=Zychaea mexicana TaxID=64656 RepID=UPI0022FDD2F4|nr:Cupredoxin [Zychaea mexicana]KAI9477159.1 Cupredoxin [Zychaea mexicana]
MMQGFYGSSKLLSLYFIIALLLVCSAYAELRTFELNISRGSLNPDCYERGYTGLLVNGQFPAPPIRVTKNDHVHVIIHNDVDSNHSTTIHYHGILQIGTPEADGVPGLTQVAIQPGETYHQRFQVIDQTGTYYYHAHLGLSDDTVSGPFIVYESEDAWPSKDNKKKLKDGPYEYDDERTLFLSEWWHQTEQERMDYIMGTNYRGMVGADSYLINGKAVYSRESGCEYPTIDVEPQKVYRVRVIGGLTLAVVGVSFARHNLTIIEVDGQLVKPHSVSYLEVAPGQRFSVLLTTDQPAADQSYFIDTKPYYIRETESNGRAILRYNTKLPATTASVDEHPKFPPPTPQWHFADLAPFNPPSIDLEKEADRTIVIKPMEKVMADNTTAWLLNDRLYYPSDGTNKAHPPLLAKFIGNDGKDFVSKQQQRLEADSFDPDIGAYTLQFNETVDIVIHTTAIANGVCIGHPWHTHGHYHYVLAHGAGEYVHEQDKDLRTYQTAIARDTSFVYPVQPGPPPRTAGNTLCGWSKIRIYTSNPGVWPLHCHITSHMVQGMMTVLVAAPDKLSLL